MYKTVALYFTPLTLLMMVKKKKQQAKGVSSANVNERKDKKDRQDKNKSKDNKIIVVERPRVCQLDFKGSFRSYLKVPKTFDLIF